jgi:hypothetical protein
MTRFTVYATVITQLETEIEADSLEEAEKYADNELITADFEAMQSEFTLDLVREVK